MHIGLGIRMSGNRGAGGGFSPNALFASGEAGDWFDPSDLSRMWQDTAGTTPVTADGQTVARIDGQRGVVSLQQSDAAKRPAYKTSAGLHWLQFDGTNDAFASAATLDLSGTDEVTVCAGVRKLSDAATGFVLETSVDSFSNNGAIFLSAPDSLGDGSYLAWSRGTTSRFAKTVGFTAPTTNLLTLLGNISGDTITLRVDGDQEAQDTSDQGTGNFGNYTLFVGSRNQSILFFNGNIYFLLIRGALTSGADLTALEGFAAAKTGVTL
jgi:hypothetical protein